jgi:hypothetical protein
VWFEFHDRHGYDPLFVYYRTHYQHRGIDYLQQMRRWHEHLHEHEDRRPPHTFEAQANLATRIKQDSSLKHSLLGRTISELIGDAEAASRFRRLQDQERRSLANTAAELRGLAKQRVQIERNRRPQTQRERGSAEGRSSSNLHVPDIKLKLPETSELSAPKSMPRPPAATPRLPDAQSDRPNRGQPSKKPKVRADQPRPSEAPPAIPDAFPNRPRPNRQTPKRKVDVPKSDQAPRPDRPQVTQVPPQVKRRPDSASKARPPQPQDRPKTPKENGDAD